ncbi:MAG: hypothetical protein A2W93_02690 [Bacteroidetes bacterium GWF2_43_63]|nr:MAG: hypothetical protein A2W94_08695 [Bacteroidetes bacterium GWE2_42_42]OFY53575.1 MAG: hypothetical protein A2W93_02690 [Bacteroidetes bacterium GWF2_43_63]HBG71092.1 hypothetical protein [Bacteroidales bacterium]HCB63670.1 hypothetical protein [Bacteroidales bacterium]HCY24419.1 hypothetical protein [Bacteroidales bacterium]
MNTMRLLNVAIILLFSGSLFAQTAEFGRQSPYLIENLGQVSNSDGTPATQVLFSMTTPGIDFYLTNDGITYVFKRGIEDEQAVYDPIMSDRPAPLKEIQWHRVDATPVGASIDKKNIEIVYSKTGTVSFYNELVPEGLEHMRPVQSVTLKNIYPGIDWQFVVEEDFLKYNFILHAGADMSQIKMKFEGQDKITLKENSLLIETSLGALKENKIESFTSTGISVGVNASLDENILSYQLEKMPELKDGETLIIDPPLVWGTYYGGTGNDLAIVMERNNNGYIYVLMEVSSTDFPVLNAGAPSFYQGAFAGTVDVGIVKFTEDGIRVWSSYYGGALDDKPSNLFYNGTIMMIVGGTTSFDFPTLNSGIPGSYFDNTLGGTKDGFIITFGPMDTRIWATYLGGTSNYDHANDCSFDGSRLIVVGNTYSDATDFPLVNLPGAYFQNTFSVYDVFVTEFTTTFSMSWSTLLGATVDEKDVYCDIDSSGRLGLAYACTSSDLPLVNTLPGCYQQAFSGGVDYGITLFNTSRQISWQTCYGGTGNDFINDIICDFNDGWLLTGSSASVDFPVVNNISASFYQAIKGGGADAVILRFGNNGQQRYSSFYGGSVNDAAKGITFDSRKNLYVVGATNTPGTGLLTLNPNDGSYFKNSNTGAYDEFLLELDSNFTLRWATYLGGSYDDELRDVRVSPSDHVFAVGFTKSQNHPLFDLTPGTSYFDNQINNNGTGNGNRDAVIMKFIPCPENFNSIAGLDSVCYGLPDTLVTTGGFTYTWNTGSVNDTIIQTITADTSYIVTATHLWGCVERDTFVVKVMPLPVITFTGDSMVCLNDSMHLGVDGGVNYVWENGFTTDSISFLPAASEILTVTVTNSFGCTTQDSIQTTVYPLPVPLITGDNTPCLYDTTSISASGGVSFVWSTTATTPAIDIAWNNTGTFDYNVIATDVNGCSDTAFFTATVTNLPEFWLGNDTIICDLTTITLDPGIAGASYNWSTGAVTQTLDVSSADTYSLDLADANNCHFSDTINVAVQPLPVITFSGADTTCFGSSITMTATAPTGISYMWSNGLNTSTITFTPTASGLDTIAVTITDALTCTKTDSLEFMVYALPLPTIAGDVTPCLHDTTTLTASGGISYVWSTGATTTAVDIPFNSMGTYNYYTIAKDIHACSDTAFYTATVLALPTFNLGPDTIICDLTSIPLDPEIAGATYNWSTGATTQSITVNSADSYSLQLTDGNTCKYADTIDVAIQLLPVITFSGADTTCFESSITMTATAPTGTSYLWSNGLNTSTITFTPTASGLDTIAVTVTDALTCTKTDSLEFMVYALPTPAISGNLSVCTNDTLALTVNGGISYLWSSGTPAASANFVWSSAGSNTVYSVATDIHSCSDTAFHTVNVLPQPIFNLGADTTICAFTSITLTPGIAAAAYDWSTGAITQTITIGTADTYELELTGSNGCKFADSITVAVQPYPTIAFGGDTVVCYSHPITITATGGVSYAWENSLSGASITFVPLTTDTLTVIVTDIYGCASTDSVSFDVLPLPIPAIAGVTEICQFNSTTLTASGGASYQWSTGQSTAAANVSSSVAGIYDVYVIVTGANLCFDTAFHQIDVHALPVVDLGNDTNICEGTNIILDAANAGASFNWNTSVATQTISVSTAGTYSVTVTDANTCQNADTVMVSTTPFADASITDVAYVCLNGTTFSFVAAQGGGSWSGDGITNAATGEFNPGVAGVGNTTIVYTITGLCGDTDSSVIEVADIPVIDFTSTDETCPDLNDGTLILNIYGGTPPYAYDLDGSLISDTTTGLAPDTYLLTISDSRSCSETSSVLINAEDTPCGEADLYVPNIFSPNGDLENDVLYVRSNFIKSMSWYIYDRYGEKVFDSKSIDTGWDGEFQGIPVQSGVYFWHIKATMLDESVIEREGNVTVVR